MKKLFLKFLFPFINENYDLENKWWHRLAKIIFIIILTISFFLLFNYDDHIGIFYLGIGEEINRFNYVGNNNISDILFNIFFEFLFLLLLLYLINIFLQLLYYKGFLYIIYGKK